MNWKRGFRPALCFGLLGLSVVTENAGAEAASAQIIHLSESLDEAARNSAELAAARASVQVSEAQVSASWSGFFPQVNANVGYSRGTGSSVAQGSADANVIGNYSAGVTATQSLFSGFRDQARVAEARAQLKASSAEFASAKAKLAADVKQAFVALLTVQEQVRLSESILERRRENVRLVELRFDVGRENRGSLLLSRAYLRQAEADKASAQRLVPVRQRDLARLMGRGIFDGIVAEGAIEPKSAESVPDFVALTRETPDFAKMGSDLDLSEAQIREARADFFPELSLSAAASKVGENWVPDTNRWSVGVNLSVPLFAGGKHYFALKAASAVEHRAQATASNTQSQIELSLRQAHANYAAAVDRFEAGRAMLEAQRVREEIAKSKYNTGLFMFDDWDRAESDLITQEKQNVANRQDALGAEALWIQAQGKGEIP